MTTAAMTAWLQWPSGPKSVHVDNDDLPARVPPKALNLSAAFFDVGTLSPACHRAWARCTFQGYERRD